MQQDRCRIWEVAISKKNGSTGISLEGDRIVTAPAPRKWKLDELVEKITPSNAHQEIQWGDRTGKEIR